MTNFLKINPLFDGKDVKLLYKVIRQLISGQWSVVSGQCTISKYMRNTKKYWTYMDAQPMSSNSNPNRTCEVR